MILIGAGGHSKSVADSVDLTTYEIVGFLDENKMGEHMNLPILGKTLEDLGNYAAFQYFITIGDIEARKIWFERLLKYNIDMINIIDKTAVIASTAELGRGNFIGKYAVINAGAKIGDNNVINTKALVEHECIVGCHTHLSTNSTINGNVVVEDEVFLGSCAVCNGNIRIGEGAIVGSGCVLIKDVERYTTVVGVPGRVVKRRGQCD